MWKVFVFGLTGLFSSGWAGGAFPSSLEWQNLPSDQELSYFVVKGKNMNLKITPSPAGQGGEAGSVGSFLKVKKKGGKVLLTEKGFPPSSSFYGENKKPYPLWLKLPAGKTVKVILFSGKVDVQKLSFQKLFVSVLNQAHTEIKNTKGVLDIVQNHGDVVLKSHRGKVNLYSQDISLRVEDLKGPGVFKFLRGKMRLLNSSGFFDVRLFQGDLILRKSSSRLHFHGEKGGVYLRGFKGSVTGYLKEGEVRGQITQPHEVRMETGTADMFLDFPGTQAWLQAESWDGKVKTPPYFHRIRTGGVHRSEGRLRGGKTGRKNEDSGSVILKTRSGSITVYQSR